MAEMKLDIDIIVDITLAVERKARMVYERDIEDLNERIEELTDERDSLTAKYYDHEKTTSDLVDQIRDLTGQKDRQAAKINELMEKLEKYSEYPTFEILLKTNEQNRLGREKAEKEVEHLKNDRDELLGKLEEANRRIEAVSRYSDRWVRPADSEPPLDTYVMVTTQTGSVVEARVVMEAGEPVWYRKSGQKMKAPLAWMSRPEPAEEV